MDKVRGNIIGFSFASSPCPCRGLPAVYMVGRACENDFGQGSSCGSLFPGMTGGMT